MESCRVSMFCGSCFAPFSSENGCVLSCSCFLCPACWRRAGRPVGGGLPVCPACDTEEPDVADLASSDLPTEVSKVLADAPAKLEELSSCWAFQKEHYVRVVEQATSATRKAREEQVSVERKLYHVNKKLNQLEEELSGNRRRGLAPASVSRQREGESLISRVCREKKTILWK